MITPYTQQIRQILAQVKAEADPRHIEAYMRLEHPTLDGLTTSQWRSEVRIALACIQAGGEAQAERCAQSYGL